jgi:hypothetical protein
MSIYRERDKGGCLINASVKGSKKENDGRVGSARKQIQTAEFSDLWASSYNVIQY